MKPAAVGRRGEGTQLVQPGSVVTIRDRAPVADLRDEGFVLLEDGRPQGVSPLARRIGATVG